MANLEPAKRLLVKAAKGLSEIDVQKGAKELVSASRSDFNLLNFKVPLVTSDPEVEKIIDEFQLRDPEKMIRFLVESHFARLESIKDGFADLQEIDLINSISYVGGAKRTYKRAMANPKSKTKLLEDVSLILDQGIEQLQEKAMLYIDKIREIDNRPRLSFFGKAKLDLKKVDTNNHCAKSAVNAIIEAVNLQMAIAAELGWNIDSSVTVPFEEFKEDLLKGDNCSLMHAYDDEAKSEYWLKLPQMLDNALETADTLQDYLDSTEDSDFDYDNIEFN